MNGRELFDDFLYRVRRKIVQELPEKEYSLFFDSLSLDQLKVFFYHAAASDWGVRRLEEVYTQFLSKHDPKVLWLEAAKGYGHVNYLQFSAAVKKLDTDDSGSNNKYTEELLNYLFKNGPFETLKSFITDFCPEKLELLEIADKDRLQDPINLLSNYLASTKTSKKDLIDLFVRTLNKNRKTANDLIEGLDDFRSLGDDILTEINSTETKYKLPKSSEYFFDNNSSFDIFWSEIIKKITENYNKNIGQNDESLKKLSREVYKKIIIRYKLYYSDVNKYFIDLLLELYIAEKKINSAIEQSASEKEIFGNIITKLKAAVEMSNDILPSHLTNTEDSNKKIESKNTPQNYIEFAYVDPILNQIQNHHLDLIAFIRTNKKPPLAHLLEQLRSYIQSFLFQLFKNKAGLPLLDKERNDVCLLIFDHITEILKPLDSIPDRAMILRTYFESEGKLPSELFKSDKGVNNFLIDLYNQKILNNKKSTLSPLPKDHVFSDKQLQETLPSYKGKLNSYYTNLLVDEFKKSFPPTTSDPFLSNSCFDKIAFHKLQAIRSINSNAWELRRLDSLARLLNIDEKTTCVAVMNYKNKIYLSFNMCLAKIKKYSAKEDVLTENEKSLQQRLRLLTEWVDLIRKKNDELAKSHPSKNERKESLLTFIRELINTHPGIFDPSYQKGETLRKRLEHDLLKVALHDFPRLTDSEIVCAIPDEVFDHCNEIYPSNKNIALHAEWILYHKITDLFYDDLTPPNKLYLGVSKLCCADCKFELNKLQSEPGLKLKVVTRGAHGMPFGAVYTTHEKRNVSSFDIKPSDLISSMSGSETSLVTSAGHHTHSSGGAVNLSKTSGLFGEEKHNDTKKSKESPSKLTKSKGS